jgi:1,4-dihydroxy-2-naphthoate octaprenyltransferase
MKFLKIIEKAWLFAAIAAFILGTYYLITLHSFVHLVYFPYLCTLFCLLIYRNIHSQRVFNELHKRK